VAREASLDLVGHAVLRVEKKSAEDRAG
jgi:hypothetical protein